MAWTYDNTKLKDTTASTTYPPTTLGQRYQVRLWLQDTNTARQLFQDEELDYQISVSANAAMAAAFFCDILVAKSGGVKAKKIGDLSIQYDPEYYRTLGASLRANGFSHQVPYLGSMSVSEKQALQNDADWVTPAIPRGLDNNPAAPGPDSPPINPTTNNI